MNENPYQSPSEETLKQKQVSNKYFILTLVASLLLMIVAWALAHQKVYQGMGAFPAFSWLLQWASIALMFTAITFRCYPDKKGVLIFSLFFNFLFGAVWWIGLAIFFSKLSKLEQPNMIMEVVELEIRLGMGAESIGEASLYKFVGPVVRPLCLSGPRLMHNLNFLWAGLSTVIMIGYLYAALSYSKISFLGKNWKWPTLRELVILTAIIIVYYIPSLLRLLLHIFTLLDWL